jgi:hypothetical protein
MVCEKVFMKRSKDLSHSLSYSYSWKMEKEGGESCAFSLDCSAYCRVDSRVNGKG